VVDGEIHNSVATAVCLVAAGGIAYWFNGRREEARRTLYGHEEGQEEGPKPTPEEAGAIRGRVIGQAFLGGGAFLALFLVLDWLF
jgi:hypothetical protein